MRRSKKRKSKPKHKYKTIAVEDDIHEELMILKAILGKRNMSEVIRELINHRRKTMTKEEILAENTARMMIDLPKIVKRVMDVRTDVLMKEIEKRPTKVSMEEELRKLKEMFETFKKLKEGIESGEKNER